MKVRADLHIHTCLSPCGDNSMVPKTIVEKAIEKKLNMIAVCDHNTCGNVKPVMEYAKERNITVIPGMEANSREEVHTIALFESVESARKMEDFIFEKLSGENNDDAFGYQLLIDRHGEITDAEKRYLLGAPDISIENIVSKINELGGIAIASHIDRESFSIIGQLGFIPPSINFSALEISPLLSLKDARKKFPDYKNFEFLTFSDAHFPADIGRVFSEFDLEENSFIGLRKHLGRKN